MLPVKHLKVITAILCCTLLIASCKKEKKTSWDTELLVPIVSSSLSLQNIVKDSAIKTNSDNSLTLAYSSSLYDFNLADQVVNIPDTSIGQKFTLNELALPNQSVSFRTSLGSLAQNMLASPDAGTQLLGQFIISQNNQNTVIPAVNGLAPAPFIFDASQLFDSALLQSGVVQLWVVNHLPIPISGATVSLVNHSDQTPVASTNLGYVAAYDSAYFEIPIGGARITSQLDFIISNLSTPGSNGQQVHMDTTDYIDLRVFVTQLKAIEAWAKFPTQNVVDIIGEVTVDMKDRKLTYIDARRGFLHVYITNSVAQKMYLEYTLVGAYDNYGHPLKQYTTVPAAVNGVPVTIDSLLDITGFSINLTGADGSKFNTYTQRVVARIDSTGEIAHITNADSLNIRYELIDIAPNYIKGYVGRDTMVAIDSADFAFLNMFKSGSIDLESVNMNFTVENGLGVDGQVKINSLTAISPNNGTRTLTGSLIGQPLVVNRATDFPLIPAINNYTLNNGNSNIKDLLGILPNKLKYDVEVKTNVNGNNQQYRDFAYLESALKIKLNAEIPLSLIANHLLLRDTIGFDLSQANTNVNGITDGLINLIVQNKYPIETNISMIIYDENWNAVDTLTSNQLVAAAELDNNCRAQQPRKTKIPMYINPERMEKIKTGRQAVIIADFNSASSNQTCNGHYLKIYSDYKLDITLTARFGYEVNGGF